MALRSRNGVARTLPLAMIRIWPPCWTTKSRPEPSGGATTSSGDENPVAIWRRAMAGGEPDGLGPAGGLEIGGTRQAAALAVGAPVGEAVAREGRGEAVAADVGLAGGAVAAATGVGAVVSALG